MPRHVITPLESIWLFVSASDEPRHLWDIVFGADILRRRNVPDANIHIFTDHPAPETILRSFGLTNTHALDSLISTARTFAAHHCVAIVTGHGQPAGIGMDAVTITPAALLRAVRSVAELQLGVVVLGQCFAGVFHYLDASQEPALVLLGATNLSNSVSAPLQLRNPVIAQDGSAELRTWQANLFLYFFFLWLLAPSDVDGDGDFTLMDAYKFAGSHSSGAVTRAKSRSYLRANQLAAQLEDQRRNPAPSPADRLQIQATGLLLEQTLQILHNHQEPWVLNALVARDVALLP